MTGAILPAQAAARERKSLKKRCFVELQTLVTVACRVIAKSNEGAYPC